MRAFIIYLTGLVVIFMATFVLFVTGKRDAAWIMGYGGTFVYMVLVLAYVIVFHSRKRWPNTTISQRIIHIFTFIR